MTGVLKASGMISNAFSISIRTVERVRERLAKEGLESALNREKSNRIESRIINGENEVHLIALACSNAPEGYGRRTLRLLRLHMVELGYVDSVFHQQF